MHETNCMQRTKKISVCEVFSSVFVDLGDIFDHIFDNIMLKKQFLRKTNIVCQCFIILSTVGEKLTAIYTNSVERMLINKYLFWSLAENDIAHFSRYGTFEYKLEQTILCSLQYTNND